MGSKQSTAASPQPSARTRTHVWKQYEDSLAGHPQTEIVSALHDATDLLPPICSIIAEYSSDICSLYASSSQHPLPYKDIDDSGSLSFVTVSTCPVKQRSFALMCASVTDRNNNTTKEPFRIDLDTGELTSLNLTPDVLSAIGYYNCWKAVTGLPSGHHVLFAGPLRKPYERLISADFTSFSPPFQLQGLGTIARDFWQRIPFGAVQAPRIALLHRNNDAPGTRLLTFAISPKTIYSARGKKPLKVQPYLNVTLPESIEDVLEVRDSFALCCDSLPQPTKYMVIDLDRGEIRRTIECQTHDIVQALTTTTTPPFRLTAACLQLQIPFLTRPATRAPIGCRFLGENLIVHQDPATNNKDAHNVKVTRVSTRRNMRTQELDLTQYDFERTGRLMEVPGRSLFVLFVSTANRMSELSESGWPDALVVFKCVG